MTSRLRDRFRVAGEPLPDYVDPARTFFGSDAAISSYLTQLEGYAADGAEAQDLLDAAEAAGTPAEAIAILEAGGAPTLGTYADLAEVVSAIGLGLLVEGQAWRIAWTGDAYIADGEVLGVVQDGHPVWRGILPTPYLATLGYTTSGSVSYDAAGRPIMTASGAASNTLHSAQLNMAVRPSSRIKATGIFQATGTPTLTGADGPSVRVILSPTPTAFIVASLAYFSGVWQGACNGIGNPFSSLSPALNPATAQSIQFDIQIWKNTRDALPRGFFLITHGANAAQNYDSGTGISALFVDWRSALDLRVRFDNRDLGVPSTWVATGLTIEP